MTTDQETLTTRTREALGNDIVNEIERMKFCILGCGAVGTLYAEMLIRSGATKLVLIDGDDVEESNLNRTLAFTKNDIGTSKVLALKARLESINPDIFVEYLNYMFRKPKPDNEEANKGMQMVTASSLVIIAMDDEWPRYYCEQLCEQQSIAQISIGIRTKQNGDALYECAWNIVSKKPDSNNRPVGYGQGSYASIVMEATAAGFGMMLTHLSNEQSGFNYLARCFNGFRPKCQYFKSKDIPS